MVFNIGKYTSPMDPMGNQTHHPRAREYLECWEFPFVQYKRELKQNWEILCRVVWMLTGWWFQIVFDFHPYLGKIPILTNIFQRGWNHQLGMLMMETKLTLCLGESNSDDIAAIFCDVTWPHSKPGTVESPTKTTSGFFRQTGGWWNIKLLPTDHFFFSSD